MATGRIGVTPTLRTRWSREPAGGTTSLSGLDDNSVSLVYDVGYEQVYRNGVLLSRGNDYTATDGTTITLIDATIAGDIIEVFANQSIPLSDAISRGQFTAKGSLLSATAASTPAVLAVGSNNQVLTADSAEATGLKWATVSAGSLTLLSTTTVSGSNTTISSINQNYTNLLIIVESVTTTTSDAYSFNVRNGTTNLLISAAGVGNGTTTGTNSTTASWEPANNRVLQNTGGNNACVLTLTNYASTTAHKGIFWTVGYEDTNTPNNFSYGLYGGYVRSNSAINSFRLNTSGSATAGTIRIYGVN